MRSHILDHPLSYYTICFFVQVVPIGLCRFLGKITSIIVYAFSRKDRRMLASNLSLALKKPANDPLIRRTVHRIFLNYGQYMIDFFFLPQLPPHKTKRFFAHLRGEPIIQRALARGRGVILLSAHIGNWEFGGTMMRLSNYPLTVVAMAHNTVSTNNLVNKLREGKGIDVIEVNASPFSGIRILNVLRNNGIVAMIGDKDFFGQGRKARFFGIENDFPIGPIVLAMKSKAALIPAFVLRQPDGRYLGILEEAIPLLGEDGTSDTIDENLRKVVRIFEKYIRIYPDQWYHPDPIGIGTKP